MSKSTWKKSTWSQSYKFNDPYFKKLIEYYKLPWWKRLFRRIPK